MTEGERRVVRSAIDELLSQGFHIGVCDGEGGESKISADGDYIYSECFSMDDDRLWVYTKPAEAPVRRAMLYFVYGNDPTGSEVLSDYSCSLEVYLKDTLALAESLA